MQYNIDDNAPIQIEVKETSVFAQLCYREMVSSEYWYREGTDDQRKQTYLEHYKAEVSRYKRAVLFDRLDTELKTTTLTIN